MRYDELTNTTIAVFFYEDNNIASFQIESNFTDYYKDINHAKNENDLTGTR
jgi:hypothetical protein